MKTLKFGLASWAIVIAVFAAVILWNDNSFGRLAWGLLAFWFLGSIIPATLEDVALFLAEYLHLYAIAKLLMFCSHILYKLPLMTNDKQRSMGAVGLSRIWLMQGNLKQAHRWAEKALNTECGNNWRLQFRSLSLLGLIHFKLGEFDTAETYLRQAWELLGSNTEGMQFLALAEILNEWQSRNLDILGKIKVQAGNFDEAEQLFNRSSRLRAETQSLSDTAATYKENAQGTIECARGNLSECEKHVLSAARNLPAKLRLAQHREVVMNVLCNLKRLRSHSAQELYRSMLSRYGKELHSSQRQSLLGKESNNIISCNKNENTVQLDN